MGSNRYFLNLAKMNAQPLNSYNGQKRKRKKKEADSFIY